MFVDLLYNAVLLLALGYLYSLIARRWAPSKLAGQIYKGLLFGAVALGVMYNPVTLLPGLVFDTRSAVLGVAGLFGGPLTAAIAVVMAAAYRLWCGGYGVAPGVVTSLTSGLIGAAYYLWLRRRGKSLGTLGLYVFGVVVHVAMLLGMLSLGWTAAKMVLANIAAPVMLIYPVVTLLLALLLSDGEKYIETEKRLAASENRFRLSFDNANIGMVIVGVDGRLLLVNEQFAAMLGHDKDELIGRHFNDITHPDDRDIGKDYVASTVTGQAASARYEKRYLRKDGAVVWARVSLSLVRDAAGKPLHFITHAQDISESKKAEEALRESEYRFRYFVENANDIVYALSPEGSFTYITPNWFDYFGEPAEAALGKTFEPYVHPDDVGVCRAFLNKVLATGQKQSSVEYRIQRRDGSWRWHVSNGAPLRDAQGAIIGYVGIARDVTESKNAAEALREAALRLQEAVRAANVGLWDWRLDTNEVFYSPEWKRQIGYENHEIGNGFAEWESRVHPDDLAPTMALVQRTLEGRAAKIQLEFRFRHKDGSYRWIMAQGSVLRDEAGRATRMLGSHIDITERKQAEAALRESERTLHTLMANLPGMAYRCHNDEHWTMEFVSQGCLALTGHQPEELMIGGRVSYAQVIRPEDREMVAQTVRRAMERREAFELTYIIQTAQGGQKWVWERGCGVYDDEGRLLAVEGFISDMDQLKRAEAALRANERRLGAIMEAMPDPMVVYDDQGRATFLNRAFGQVFGWRPDELLGQAIPFVPDDQQEAVQATIRELFAHGGPVSLETKRLTKDGRLLDIVISAARVLDEAGRVTGMVVNLTDVTRTKRLEAQLRQAQKMEAIGTLAGGIAHDFNNILTAISGNAELALDRANQGVATPAELEKILGAADRARRLIKKIMFFSRKAEFHPQPLNLNKVVTDAVSIIERTIPKMISVELRLEPAPWMIKGDVAQLEQIILNLASNAQDAMQNGGKLLIETANVSLDEKDAASHFHMAAGDYLRLTISDTGVGIDKHDLEHIFEPFYTTKGIGKGTGMGLASVYGAVQNHGGHIYCYSEPGQGAVFKCYLPATREDAEGLAAPAFEVEAIVGGAETVLLVDDEAALRELSGEMLEAEGYRVLTADSGERAIEIVRDPANHVDLVVMDLGMPGMGGHEALRRIMAGDPQARVIIASGYLAESHIRQALEAGAVGYVTKPYRRAELLTAIRRALDA